jgi:hypothetical protein
MGCGLLECAAADRTSVFGLNFEFGGQHCDEMLIRLGKPRLSGKFEVNVEVGHAPPSSADVRNGWSYTPLPHVRLWRTQWQLISFMPSFSPFLAAGHAVHQSTQFSLI